MKLRFVLSLAVLAIFVSSQAVHAQLPGLPPGQLPPPGMLAPPPGLPGPMMMPPPPAGFLDGNLAAASYNMGDAGKGCNDCGKGDCYGCRKGGKGCNGCGKGDCKGGGNCHRFSLFGEFLYLNARDSDVAYGVEVNSAVAAGQTPVQVGRIGVVDPDYQPGFRAGVNFFLDECSSFTFTYTMWEAGTFDQVTRSGTNAIQSLVAHPTSLVVNSTGVTANAQYDLSMDIVDLDYKEMIAYDCDYSVSYLVGLRYAGFEQQLLANTPINGNRQVETDIDFNGVGLKLGLEGERFVRQRGFVYSKLNGTFAAGKFAATFDERDASNATVVDTEWEAERIMTIVDFEVGAGWCSDCENWRFNVGYIYSAWTGMVKTDEWITGVHTNNYDNLRDVMTFDGLTAKLEGRF